MLQIWLQEENARLLEQLKADAAAAAIQRNLLMHSNASLGQSRKDAEALSETLHQQLTEKVSRIVLSAGQSFSTLWGL